MNPFIHYLYHGIEVEGGVGPNPSWHLTRSVVHPEQVTYREGNKQSQPHNHILQLTSSACPWHVRRSWSTRRHRENMLTCKLLSGSHIEPSCCELWWCWGWLVALLHEEAEETLPTVTSLLLHHQQHPSSSALFLIGKPHRGTYSFSFGQTWVLSQSTIIKLKL